MSQQVQKSDFHVTPRAFVTALAFVFVLAVVLVPAAQAQTFNVLHSFTGGPDGATPMAGLTLDRAGNLYGTASAGGTGYGTAFRIVRSGTGWTFRPLYSFQGGNDGATPTAALVFGPDGSLYGTTQYGGIPDDCLGSNGCGTVFTLKPPPTHPSSVFSPWMESAIYRFDVRIGDGVGPYSEVVFDAAGNLYGTASAAGGGCNGVDCGGCDFCGTVYQMKPTGNGWTYSILYTFRDWNNGAAPEGGLVFDQAGNLYGTNSTGGSCGFGTLFELLSSDWTEQNLHTFCGYQGDGANPSASLIRDSSGNLYGATPGARPGWGTQPGSVFMLTPNNGGWTFSVLYEFADGAGPAAPLVMDAAGNLYSTTFYGGNTSNNCGIYGCGTIFKLAPSIGGWAYTELYDFSGGSDGQNPYSRVVIGANGNLYGTASAGGQYGHGVVWEITP